MATHGRVSECHGGKSKFLTGAVGNLLVPVTEVESPRVRAGQGGMRLR